jgi:LPS sulfotransferase NodH
MITLVSGLPRSGTSMMMQLLAAGGMSLLTDEVRTADADNPRGYCEFEPVKNLRADSDWLEKADGKAVKVIAQLLTYLPEEHEYKVIFMHRELDEILKSQEVMLKRRGKSGANLSTDQLARVFSNQLTQVKAFLDRQGNIKTLDMDYAGLVQNPDAYFTQLIEFLGIQLDIEKMKAVIDPNLYRNRYS